jgi:hypothetical protein
MNEKKNKIDSVVDEVIESKRVKQASYGILKMIRVLAILAIPFWLVTALIGRGGDAPLFGSIFAGVSFLIFLIVNNIINKKVSL